MNGLSETQQAVIEWLAKGHTGTSSETMAFWLGFGVKKSGGSHPWDPADFDRCLRLLAAVPALRAQLPEMRALSEVWASLVERWDEIEALHLNEIGLGWTKGDRAPRTYALMKSIVDEARPVRQR